jgi:hypothetical protein
MSRVDEGPPNDLSREDEAELRLLYGSMGQPAELEALAQALKVLHGEAIQRFRSHLADQLQTCGTSLSNPSILKTLAGQSSWRSPRS